MKMLMLNTEGYQTFKGAINAYQWVWIKSTVDIGSHSLEMALVEEHIPKGFFFFKSKPNKCLNCYEQGNFKRNFKETQTNSKKKGPIFFWNTQKMWQDMSRGALIGHSTKHWKYSSTKRLNATFLNLDIKNPRYQGQSKFYR